MKYIITLIIFVAILHGNDFNKILIEGSCKNGKFIPKEEKNVKEIVYKKIYLDSRYYDKYDEIYYQPHYINLVQDKDFYHNNSHGYYNSHHNVHHRIDHAFRKGRFETCNYCGTVEFMYYDENRRHLHYWKRVHCMC